MLMIASAVAMLIGAPVPYTPPRTLRVPTVADYLALCDREAKACSDFLFDFAWESSVGERRVPYCLPEKDPPEVVVRKVTDWLKARPAMASEPTKPALTKALVATHPC
jgi:hypothetical protein